MTKKSKLVLAMASMLGITAGAAAVSGFAWFTTTKSANVNINNIGVYSKSSALDVTFKTAHMGCSGTDVAGGISVTGDSAASTKTDTFIGDNSTKTFTLSKYPNAKPTVKVGNDTIADGNVTWSDENGAGKTVTLATAPATDAIVAITYTPYEALTDLSSTDGKNIYKPVWTASGEGQYATEINTATEGYVSFTMTLAASGASDLEVYINQPSIDPAKAGDATDIRTANITRVAIIDDTTTRMILQNEPGSPNNVGISSTNATTPNWDPDGAGALGTVAWDLKASGGTTEIANTLLVAPSATDKSTHDADWAGTVGNQTAANHYVTKVDAGSTKDIKVTIWLEGTNYINDGGGYTLSPENGMIKVNLPLLAF